MMEMLTRILQTQVQTNLSIWAQNVEVLQPKYPAPEWGGIVPTPYVFSAPLTSELYVVSTQILCFAEFSHSFMII